VLITGSAQADDELVIACSNINDPATCNIGELKTTSFQFVDTVRSVLNSYLNNRPPSGTCVRDGDNITCDLSQASTPGLPSLTLGCSLIDPNNARCGLSNLPDAYFSMSCERQSETGGSCRVSTSRDGIRDHLQESGIVVNDNRFNVGVNLLAACASRGGTEAFQRECDAVLQALTVGDTSGVSNLLTAIAPQNSDLALDMNQTQNEAQSHSLTGRMSRLRNNQRGLDTAGLAFFDGGQWVNIGTLLASNGEQSNDSSPPVAFANSRLGAFVDGTILRGEQDGDEFESQAEHDATMLVIGIDYRLRDDLIIGTAYRFASTEATVSDDLSSVKVTGYSLLGYLTHYRDNWYGEATLAYGSDNYKQQRRLICGNDCPISFDVLANSNYHGDQFVATLGAGYELQLQALRITPNVQLALASQKTDGYRETARDLSAAGAGYLLDIGSQSRDQQTFTVGVSASYAISTNFGVILPMASVDLRNEMKTDTLAINGHFVGDVSNREDFLVLARDLDKSYLLIGLGAAFQLEGGNSGYLQFRTIQGYDKLSQSELTAAWRWEL
jgi:outer membrane autotransporter protein